MVLTVTDYGLGPTTVAQTNLLKLDRVQNEAMRVILGTTKDTPIGTTRFLLDLTPLLARQEVERVKAYFSAVENPCNPLHEAVKDTEGCRLGRHKSWMGQTEGLNTARMPADSSSKPRSGRGTQTDSGVSVRHIIMPDYLAKHCREWPAGKMDSEILIIIKRISRAPIYHTR